MPRFKRISFLFELRCILLALSDVLFAFILLPTFIFHRSPPAEKPRTSGSVRTPGTIWMIGHSPASWGDSVIYFSELLAADGLKRFSQVPEHGRHSARGPAPGCRRRLQEIGSPQMDRMDRSDHFRLEHADRVRQGGAAFAGNTTSNRFLLPADPFTGQNRCRSAGRSEEHTSELQSPDHLVCRLLLEKKKKERKVTI